MENNIIAHQLVCLIKEIDSITMLSTTFNWISVNICCLCVTQCYWWREKKLVLTTNQIFFQVGNILFDVEELLLIIVDAVWLVDYIMVLTLDWINQMSRFKVSLVIVWWLVRCFKQNNDLKRSQKMQTLWPSFWTKWGSAGKKEIDKKG